MTRARSLPVLGLIAALAGCDAAPTTPALEPPEARAADLPGLIVSPSRGLVDVAPRAFVSLPPRSLDREHVLRVATNDGRMREVRTIDGGFDPIGIDGAPGAMLRIDLWQAGSPAGSMRVPVPLSLPPIIIRTDPERRRTSVPLNVVMAVVFSEPIAPASINAGTVQLSSASGPTPIALRLRDDGTVLEVRANAPLRPATDYVLAIGSGIEDLGGEHLAEPDSVAFTTVLPSAADSTPFAVRLCPDTLRLPVGSSSGFAVLVDSGARVINTFPDSSLTWGTTDSAFVMVDWVGGVSGMAIGEAWVTVEYEGDVDSALVIVTRSPPPGPFGIFPGGAEFPAGGFTYAFGVTYPEGEEPPPVTWWTSDAAVLTVDAEGVVTTHAPGEAWLFVTDDTTVDSALISVYDPTPPLAAQYMILPTSVLLQAGDSLDLIVAGPASPPPPVTWSTADPSVATVTSAGRLHAVAPGRTEVQALFADGSGIALPVPVVAAGSLGRVALEPEAVEAVVGDTVRFRVVYDSAAAANYGGVTPAWSWSAPAGVLAWVPGGGFRAMGAGTAQVVVHIGPLQAPARVTVREP